MSSSPPAQKTPSYLRQRFAQNLRLIRMRHEMSQERLAELAGFHRTYVSQVERGVQNVSLDNVAKLADVLGVDAGVLLSAMDG